METGWNLVSAAAAYGGGGRGLNSSCTTTSGTFAWDIWQLGSSSRHDWINIHDHLPNATVAADATPTLREESALHALIHHQASPSISSALYAGAGTQFNPPDPQLMCLKLGKRHYFEDAFPLGDRHVATAKRGRVGPYYGYGYGPSPETGVTVAAPPPMPTVVPRCQVEGCEAALFNAKDYHRRHKVCEMHSKAPKVKVHGIEQRFCQQCSRFHEVSEFDESKRSCRRRLAGHNERRRKTSHDHSLVRNPLQGGRFSSSTTAEHALSLLSSSRNNDQQWKVFSSSDLSSRCSAALRELIAENRAYSSILASKHQFILDHKNNHHTFIQEHQPFSENQNNTSSNNSDHQILLHDHNSDSWGRINEEANPNVTLNLAPVSAFEILSMRGKSDKDTAEECSDIWSSLGGTHVV